ncbi:uncharacterized protein LOC123210641 [Mangifera indica]|uniref:uncharacterized protein LOC123210641 n=1 Tax=Mangifera indica TaxID=29780 RepID=UPI001CF986F9|nr:uncharacterized protein LOC123210641 [Mangifera indica]
MEKVLQVGVQVREALTVPPTSDGIPTKKLAHFLKPTMKSSTDVVFELPSHCLDHLPPASEPKNWPLKVAYHGWRFPQMNWRRWVEKMVSLYECAWEKVGIREAILNSVYQIKRNDNLILGLAERWCPATKSFIFSWGEATITLEDMMIAGYSVLGSPVFCPVEEDELKQLEKKLSEADMELKRSKSGKAHHCLWMKKFMDSGSEIEHEAFLALWLSRFVLSPSDVIVKSVFPIVVHLARGTRIALAPAVLASIYNDLSSLKEKIVALTKLDNWGDEVNELAIAIRSPFQLVQIWAWERFSHLRPDPNLIKTGEPRFARWHSQNIIVENVRKVINSSKDDFDWRPYVKPVKNWKFPKFYGEKEMWISVNPNLSEELLSFAHCLRVSELVGLKCIEQYLPHRVAMQFGMDQDLPVHVARINETAYVAWSYYSQPICYALYIPCRLNEGDVTSRYSEWWKQSISGLQGASERSFIGTKKIMETAKGKKEAGTSSSIKTKPVTNAKNFIKRFKITQRRFDGLNKMDGASAHSSSSLKSLWKGNDSLVPPGFPPKSDVAATRDIVEEYDMTVADFSKHSKKHDNGKNKQVPAVEHLSSKSKKFSSSTTGDEALKRIDPQTELAEEILQDEPDIATDSKARDQDHIHDGLWIQDGEEHHSENTMKILELQFEERVSKLERIFALLKAERLSHG